MKDRLKFEIANQACILAGLDPLNNLYTDKSERAQTCQQFIDDVVKTSMESLNYEFARVSAPLTQMADGEGYQLPPHYIKLIGLSSCNTCDCSELRNLEIDLDVNFKILNNRLYVNTPCSSCGCSDGRELIYTALEHGFAEVPSTLKQAMSHLLAYYLSKRMGTEKDPMQLFKMHSVLIAQAKKTNESNHHLNSDLGQDIYIPFNFGSGRGRLY